MKPVRRRHPHPEIPLVSTADVSFLLLIFFLSTATLSVERGILLGLPLPGSAELVLRPDRVARVAVGADRGLSLDGIAVTADELKRALVTRVQRAPDLVVTLAIDRRAPYAAVVDALDQVKLSGARQISLRTEGDL
jgi:biopolymer transport protein ExbD